MSEQTPSHQRVSLKLIAAEAAVAILIGGGAGVGGAAVYNATTDSSGSGTTSSQIQQSTGTTSTTAYTTDGSIESVAQAVLPSVVKIEVKTSSEEASGSGIILTADGTILTNNHVVEGVGSDGQIRVDFNDGTQASATVVGTDPLTDTAVIKAESVSGLTPATLGHSSELVVGQTVVAIGSPFGLDSTVTSGIVSALDRPVNVGSDDSGNATVYPAIQTDAAINPGNSGGALVTLDGEVVGINASIRTAATDSSEAGNVGLGFAIPIDEVLPVVQQMIAGQTPTHARLGISVSAVGTPLGGDSGGEDDGTVTLPRECLPWPFGSGSTDPECQQYLEDQGGAGQGGSGQSQASAFDQMGALVQTVGDGSAAGKAGITAGDIITKVGDHLISGSDSLIATIRAYRPGDTVTVTWTRDGTEMSADVVLDSDATANN